MLLLSLLSIAQSPVMAPPETVLRRTLAHTLTAPDGVGAVVEHRRAQLWTCMERSQKLERPAPGAALSVEWRLEAGAVVGVAVDTDSAALSTCVQQRLARWRFPAEVSGPVALTMAVVERRVPRVVIDLSGDVEK